MGAGRKRKAGPLDKANGWKQFKVGDDLMLGSTEGGFMGLEVLEPDETLLFGHHKRQAQQAPDAEDEDMLAEVDEVPSNKKSKKSADKPQSKKAKLSEPSSTQPAAKGTAGSSLDLLNAKIAALEAENSALKAKNASKPDKPAGKDKDKGAKKAKKDKAVRKDKQKVAKKAEKSKAATTDAAPGTEDVNLSSTTEQIDMSAWSEFDLRPQIAAAISQAGFTKPTPIQEQCLLPAIRDRRDVIGAAQTVRALCNASPEIHLPHAPNLEWVTSGFPPWTVNYVHQYLFVVALCMSKQPMYLA